MAEREGMSGDKPMTERYLRVQKAIERGDVVELLNLAEGKLCACLGVQNGEPLCPCRMTSKQVRDAVSYAALKRGRVVRLERARCVRI